MSRRVMIRRDWPAPRWYACLHEGELCLRTLASADSHAEVIAELDALRPTLEPCS